MKEPTNAELGHLLEKLRASMDASLSREMEGALAALELQRSVGQLDTRGTLQAAIVCAWLLQNAPVVH